MYIRIGEATYPCGRVRVSGSGVSWTGVKGLELPVEGTIVTCRDDGFVMRTDRAEDYLRQTFENGVLTLTNIPEPEPGPEPVPEPDEYLTVKDMAETLKKGVNEI